MSKTYTITLEFEVKMTSSGSPMIRPSLSQPGEPAEPPELEIDNIIVEGDQKSIETLYKEYKTEKKDLGVVKIDSYDQFFADYLYNKVLDQAYNDDWTPDDDYD